MLLEKMYVRCAIDVDYPSEPRDFILGMIKEINRFSETAIVEFFDLLGLNIYYNIPATIEFPLSRLQHCRVSKDTLVSYNGRRYIIAEHTVNKSTGYFWYYVISEDNTIKYLCESDITASFNAGAVSPISQLKQYEFQNPVWYFGRKSVLKTTRAIENAFYGFNLLAGCKIFLKPHQLKTVQRCLSDKTCRYMLADEVGLGKTIEAASVLKIYLSNKHNKKVLIYVPDALLEQWKTELAFKFGLFIGKDKNNNILEIKPYSLSLSNYLVYDFVVMDEVHSLLNHREKYNQAMAVSKSSENVIMLSATPVQSRNEEYHRLLSLIQPEKYEHMPKEDFLSLLELQSRIIRKVHSLLECLTDYKEAIEDSDHEHTDDTEEAFDELLEVIEEIYDKTSDEIIESEMEQLSYEAPDFSLPQINKLVSYICEAYQFEKCVIRNRRKSDDENIREMKSIPYDMDCDFNHSENRIYRLLSDWISSLHANETTYKNIILPLVNAFFSSSAAFLEKVKTFPTQVPDDIVEWANKWVLEEQSTVVKIKSIMENPFDSYSRLVAICDYIEQEAFDKKVVVFTHFITTHKLYRQAFINLFGKSHCAFFCKDMNADELEVDTYRFQNNPDCRIMLLDETGGEGRNFQNADELICIDIPWNANTLEQRIGRLDRIGRDKRKAVVSVVVHSSDTVEQNLLDVWDRGLKLFTKAQSGLEIVMNDIDSQIQAAIMDDFKFGLAAIIDDMIAEIEVIKKKVKEERHFDIAAYQHKYTNSLIERSIEKYNESETDLFRSSMMSWASLAGFNGKMVSEDIIRFSTSSFSMRSAYNTMLVPPNMELMIGEKLNQLQNRVRILNGDKEIKKNPDVVLGTFNRELALKSDYLHFFAPGDALYDSIVQNAASAYKGKCCAIAMESSIDWEGFLFSWIVLPDELLLLKNNIQLASINSYRCFISSDMINIPVSITQEMSGNEDAVRNEILQLENTRNSELKNCIAHFGRRSLSNDFLGIKQKYMISNLNWFKERYPSVVWQDKIKDVYTIAKHRARNEIKKMVRKNALVDELDQNLSSAKASSEFFGYHIDVERETAKNQVIISAFSNPKVQLDSVCYVRMMKR